MLNWFRNLMQRRQPQTQQRQGTPPSSPSTGERWRIRSNDPWGSKNKPVLILDVRDGWVRYYINRTFDDERMRIKEFVSVYQWDSGLVD